MSTDERFLMMYMHSHDPKKWEHHVDKVLKDLDWGRDKYFKNRKLLVDKGILETKEVRSRDERTGKTVVSGFRAWIDLSAYNQYLENASACRLSASSKSVPLSKTTNKGRSDPDVIDNDDCF